MIEQNEASAYQFGILRGKWGVVGEVWRCWRQQNLHHAVEEHSSILQSRSWQHAEEHCKRSEDLLEGFDHVSEALLKYICHNQLVQTMTIQLDSVD